MALRSFLSGCAAVGLVACSSDSLTNRDAPFALGLSLSPSAVTIQVADTIAAADVAKLTLSATSLNVPITTPGGVEWNSQNPAVATVDTLGNVSAVHVGSTNVTARINGVSATSTVVVAYRAVKVSLVPTALAALVGDTVQLSASAVDAGGVSVPRTAYAFSLLDPTTGTITSTGTGTARLVVQKVGPMQVTVTAAGQSVMATGTIQPREFVATVAPGSPAGTFTISAGEDATCGLLPLGRGYCFGRGTLIGVARDTSCFDDAGSSPVPCTLVPLRIAGQLTLTSLTVGDSVACGIASGSSVYCWGSQKYGQLGNGIVGSGTSITPTLVASANSGSPALFTRVSAGGNHACGLSPTNTAWCWGLDAASQLGNGDSSLRVNASTPIPVAGGAAYLSISAGRAHTCAIRSDNIAACWGDNALGQIGNGAAGDTVDAPVAVAGSTFSNISAGGSHTCALTPAGVAWCWGGNDSGQVGRGLGAVNPSEPAPVAAGVAFRSISAGRYNTCGITTGGAAYCWGSNAYGQIGDGTRSLRDVPTLVSGGHVEFTAIAVGVRHVCAVGSNGAFCWGSNVLGALGDGLQIIVQTTPAKTATPR